MTPSELLIAKAMQEEVEEGFDTGASLIRVANKLGIKRSRVLQVWTTHLAQVSA